MEEGSDLTQVNWCEWQLTLHVDGGFPVDVGSIICKKRFHVSHFGRPASIELNDAAQIYECD